MTLQEQLMISIFQRISDRVKALLFTDAALDVEAELLSRSAERKAELLRRAQAYEQQGLPDVAAELRGRAENLSLERPLAVVLPAIGTFQSEVNGAEAPKLIGEGASFSTNEAVDNSTDPRRRKPKRR